MTKKLINYVSNPVVKKTIGNFFICNAVREISSIETIEIKTRNYNIGAKFKKTHQDDPEFMFIVKKRKNQ